MRLRELLIDTCLETGPGQARQEQGPQIHRSSMDECSKACSDSDALHVT